jgi:hypothetical protein
MLRRDHWQRQIEHLDPATDFEEIYRITTTLEFPWDMTQALSLALFRTFAVPSIGRLLHETGEFETRTKKRYDDTALLLDEVSYHGFGTTDGRRAIRRINQMHGAYDISNDDMLYVLSTFVVVPKRWMDEFGWRPFSTVEVEASTRYYRELGRLMGIRGIPETYAAFADLMDSYEAEHFAFEPGGRLVADATLRLLVTFYPRVLARPVDAFSRAVMDRPLLEAFDYQEPSRATRTLTRAALRLRARLESRLPSRRTPLHARDMARFSSYPDGYDPDELGTFPRGCPHARGATREPGGASRDGVTA